ncbi:MULE domain-containing protein [Trichonephila clavipes]|nr:MULE domain-containing protein [Trichonephila clavipes]
MLLNNSLAIGLQTAEQKEIMIKNCSKMLCIDSTHQTNEYGFYLLNLIVPDEYGICYPVAHFITNKLDAVTMYCLFDSLKERVPNLNINCVMTDDDKTTGPAFKKVFGEGVKHLLCKWLLHRAWKKQLNNLVSGFEIRNEIYASLVMLLEEKNVTKFKQMMENFRAGFVNKEPAFIKYFDDYYYNRTDLWSM